MRVRPIQPGEEAVDFRLPTGGRASDLWQRAPVVVFFFPKAMTPG